MTNDPDDWTIEAVDPRDAAASALIAALTDELAHLYQEDGSGHFRPDDVLGPRSGFVVGILGGRPVACGGYRPLGPDVAEIKRMYVEPEYRGRGLARRILVDLEARADAMDTRSSDSRQAPCSPRPSASMSRPAIGESRITATTTETTGAFASRKAYPECPAKGRAPDRSRAEPRGASQGPGVDKNLDSATAEWENIMTLSRMGFRCVLGLAFLLGTLGVAKAGTTSEALGQAPGESARSLTFGDLQG